MVIPRVKYLWRHRNAMIIDTEASAAPVMIRPKSLDISLSLLAIPRTMILGSFCISIASYSGYSFQESVNVKIVGAPNPGLIIGNATLINVVSSPASSMRAASGSGLGIFSENYSIINTPNGHPTTGRITADMEPHADLSSPKSDISFARGIKITCLGNATTHTNSPGISPFL